MKTNTKNILIGLALLGAVASSSAATQTIFDSMTGGSADAWPISRTLQMGQSFTVGAKPEFLASVVIDTMYTTYGQPGEFALELWSSIDSKPGALLKTLSGSTSPKEGGQYVYTGAYPLAADTSYYIVSHCENSSYPYF